jgi:hypothetical protein
LWGPGDSTGEVLMRLGSSPEALQKQCREVIAAGVFHDDYCMPYENNKPIFICKGRGRSLQEDWPLIKHFE